MISTSSLTRLLLVSTFLVGTSGHGYMKTPRTRNWYAAEEGTWSSGAGYNGVPKKESCAHCLNTKDSSGVCGIGNAANYDDWNDASGNPMPWASQAVFEEGDTFTVESVLTTNHAGHMEVWLCPDGDQSTQACFDSNPAQLISDDLYDGPVDANYPERAYFSLDYVFKFTYKLPDGLVGDNVLIQWHYVTANSCIPPGYRNSEAGTRLAELGWLRGLSMSDCPAQLDPTGQGVPEQFWNCAEITIKPKGEGPPTTASPVASPTTSAPVAGPVTSAPTPTPPANTATTTRYWDCSGGACGCAYLPFDDPERPAHCHSNAMFEAPAGNEYGAKFYGTAAVSDILFQDADNDGWLGEGCEKCWKVTGTSNTPGYQGATTTTLVLKGANYCPPENLACSDNNAHFDIAAPGFDVTGFSFAHTCPQREAEEAEGFASCEFWGSSTNNCDCSKFKSPVLRAGCENFLSLQWDNVQVDYEQVQCPYELDRLSCWRQNNDGYPFGIPDFCASNIEGGSTSAPTASATSAPTASATSAPTASATSAPTASATSAPTASATSAPTASTGDSFCCSWNLNTCPNPNGWCSQTLDNCNGCGGTYISSAPKNCIAKWGACTNDVNGCCDTLTCQGNQWYRQCL